MIDGFAERHHQTCFVLFCDAAAMLLFRQIGVFETKVLSTAGLSACRDQSLPGVPVKQLVDFTVLSRAGLVFNLQKAQEG